MNKIKNSCFDEYIKNISANQSEVDKIISSHTNVRDKLSKSDLNNKIVKMVLIGSYKRSTNTKTIINGDKKIDVDIAIIFKKDSYQKPQSIIDKIYNELNSYNEYSGKVTRQTRSIGVELSKTHIDVVPFQEIISDTDSPIYISSKDKQTWVKTDPIGHINHYNEIGNNCTNFTQYSKALKWWKKINKPSDSKFPISIAFEEWVALYYSEEGNKFESLLYIMKKIRDNQIRNYLQDPLNSENNFLSKMSDNNFEVFKNILNESIQDIEKGLENEDINLIRKRFGVDFPKCTVINDEDNRKLVRNTRGNINYSSKEKC
ncbi:hypothetical protein ACAG96_03500 [Candidatus Izemoplasma sp. B36]|uniref:SMODS domain-containing nucleotidyltransferase n=1 Tax=Candidatus Izemoplasma sp. B36 TaxID=3242468 RepID=UPI003555F967